MDELQSDFVDSHRGLGLYFASILSSEKSITFGVGWAQCHIVYSTAKHSRARSPNAANVEEMRNEDMEWEWEGARKNTLLKKERKKD